MTIPAAVSVTSVVVGLLSAALALRISAAPGWREVRWFAVCAAVGALFNLSNVAVTLSVSTPVALWMSRLSVLFAGLNVASWFFYTAAREGRALGRVERFVVLTSAALGVVALVPGAVVGGDLLSRPVPWLDVTYRDSTPTAFGEAVLAFYCTGVLLLTVHHARRWARREQDAAPYCVGLVALLAGAIHDSIATSGLTRGPYMLDLSFLFFVVSTGGALSSRFIASAHALEASSRRLALAQEELVKRERLAALGELAAVVAHEVRNPLAVIFNALAGLRRSRLESDQRASLLDIIQEEAARLRDMVSQLLEFARPRSPILATTSLRQTVEAAIEAARAANGAAATEIVLEAPEELAPVVCDEQLVRQAVINLVTNALQAKGRRAPVRVAIDELSDAVTIRVTDDGEGVPEELRDRIFTPFFSTRPSGTGLGLAVVERSAEAHGGKVSFTETPGGGATFSSASRVT